MGLFIVAAILVLLDYLYFKIKYSKFNGPPVWYGFPFVGMLPLYILPRSLFDKFLRWYFRYGPDVVFTRFIFPILLVKNDAVRDCQSNQNCLSRAATSFHRALTSSLTGQPHSTLTDNNQCEWRPFRKITIAALNVLPKQQKFERVSEVVDHLLKTIEDQKGQLWDYENDLSFVKVQEAANVNLGQTFETNKIDQVINTRSKLFKYATLVFVVTLFIPFSLIVKFESFFPKMIRPTVVRQGYLKLCRRVLKGRTPTADKPSNFVEAVLRLLEPEAAEAYMRDTLFLNILAATHSTQHSTQSVLCYVSLNERIQKKIHEELNQVVGSSALRIEHLADLHYLRAVIHEAGRISAPVGATTRYTSAPTTIGGYAIDANTIIGLLFISECLDVKHFPNCDEFVPERFINVDGEFEPSKHFNIFSRGNRNCSAPEFARMSVLIYCAKILQHFEIVPENKNLKITPYNKLIPVAPYFPLRFIRRDAAPEIKPVALNPGLTEIIRELWEESIEGS